MEISFEQTQQLKTSVPVYQLKNKDIVIISLQPWYYNIGSNCKTMAAMLAENNRVLYINKPVNRKTLYARTKDEGVQKHCDIIKQQKEKIYQLSNNLWEFYPTSVIESINWLPSTSLFKKYNYINNVRFAKDIKAAVKNLGFEDILIFNDNDIYNGYYLKELLNPQAYIYYCRDFLQGYDYWKKHTRVLEPELIKKSDIVVTNSSYYASYCLQYNASSYYIGQGCNLTLFNADAEHEIPEDIKHIPKPVVGYVGAIDSSRLDEKIIKNIAVNCSNINVVLVGPEDETFKKSSLHNLPNVHFLGRRPLAALPAYIQAFNVCINPQFKNEITKGNYPLKIDEYLAMGKPVVATATEAMHMFKDFCFLADTADEYAGLVTKAIETNTAALYQKRKNFAQSHTWENSMNNFYKSVLTFLHNQ